MPQQLTTTIENNFTKGLITEATALNFPENAATDTDNCVYTLIGDVTRRAGINLESGYTSNLGIGATGRNSYVWSNAGGDGLTRLLVRQQGATVYFYAASSATVTSPLSKQLLSSTVTMSTYVAAGGTFDITQECQFADGNGYLFIYHPNCDPVYCTYSNGVITANTIIVQIRDFAGIPESISNNLRPSNLTQEHLYNLTNQGWNAGNPWTAKSKDTHTLALGPQTWTVASGIAGIAAGQTVTLSTFVVPNGLGPTFTATVQSYSGTNLFLNVTAIIPPFTAGTVIGGSVGEPYCSIVPSNVGLINTWLSQVGNYPSNSDQWWTFKDTTNTFNPGTTLANTTIGTGQAPQGSIILNAFQQLRTAASSVFGITDVITLSRPTNGCWFQGRVWFTGLNASFASSGDMPYSTWTENIYFSQIVQGTPDFGHCYQINDPTSEQLFDLLPTDGGVITIQGSGAVYKLFPIQNGLLVFANNGIWFITGSQGIGFSANDYTITKISAIQSISCNSYVNVNGLPIFWNEEGIYAVTPTQGGQLTVEPLTVGTILTFYNAIPFASKKYVRGDYHPIDYIVQWTYRSTVETGITDRYHFDTILNYNTYNKAFYPYTVSAGTSNNPFINGINYISYPQIGSTTPDPTLKYLVSFGPVANLSFAEEYDESYTDWNGTFGSVNYTSYFVTGYKIRGQAIKQFQPQYIQVYHRTNGAFSAYQIQGIWDYANTGSSGRWSALQTINNGVTQFDTVSRRHKIRGHGFALQFRIQSVPGQPFDLQGWAVVDVTNQGT